MKVKGTRKCLAASLGIAAIVLNGCLSTAPKIERPTAASDAEAVDIGLGESTQPVEFKRIRFDIDRGTEIGGYTFTLYECFPVRDTVNWNAGEIRGEDDELAATFAETLAARGYTVAGGGDSLFGDIAAERKNPTFIVGAEVREISVALCERYKYPDNILNKRSGEIRMSVEWQVFSLIEERVVYKTTTEGYHEIPPNQAVRDGLLALVVGAFEDATYGLSNDQGFYQTLSKDAAPAQTSSEAIPSDPIGLAPLANFTEPARSRMEALRQSVVVVKAGVGHGSGFFIAPNLVLTNHHVSGSSGRTRIEFLDGRHATATVVRAHGPRDIALLRVDDAEGAPLPIRQSDVEILEDVIAIGAPLDEELSGTVTKGVVSNFKRFEHQGDVIQADVDIQGGNSGGPLLDSKGNVVGVSVSGIPGSAQNTSVGINFFIPIMDALDKLNVRLIGAAS